MVASDAAAGAGTQVEDESAGAGYTAAQFHPDGLILGVGSQDARIRIWEIRTAKV